MHRRRVLRRVRGLLLVSLGLFGTKTAQAVGFWYPAASMNTARGDHQAVLLNDGRVLVIGGSPSCGSADPEIYDPVSDSWSATGPPAHGSLCPSAAALLGDGRVLAAGDQRSGYPCNAAEIYSPGTNSWSFVPDTLICRNARGTATRLLNGKILVAGSSFIGGGSGSEIYDPVGNTWVLTGPMLDPDRFMNPTATRLQDGRVLVAGGVDSGDCDPDSEVYDPSSDTWSGTGPMVDVCPSTHAATLLQNGKVLVAGGDLGFQGGPTDVTQIYDPTTNSWSQAGSLNSARYGHIATPLDNGRVLVAGGVTDISGSTLSSSEIYDPATNTWTLDASMAEPRSRAAAVQPQDCRALVTGGYGVTTEFYGTADPDEDLVFGTCDNCPLVSNPDQADKEYDGKGDVCDTDDDNDGCKDTADEDPSSPVEKVGYWVGSCIGSNNIRYGFAGGDTDGDGLLDCEDPDNENDGIPDGSDGCPTTPGSDPASCTIDAICPPQTLFDLCNGAGCEQFLLKLVGLVDPDPLITEVIFEHIQVVNDALYVYPIQGTTLAESATKFAPVQGGAGAGAARRACEPIRLEAWAKEQPGSEEHFVMLVAEYDPCDVVIGAMDRGAVLLVFPPSPVQPSLMVDAVWVAGTFPPNPIVIDIDADEFPDPFDNCEGASNTDQIDTDHDLAGDACDCAPEDDSAFAIPAEVTGVTFSANHASFFWDSGVPGAGYGTAHDVVRGSLDGGGEVCLGSEIGTSAADFNVPAAGHAYWYNVRAGNVCGEGTLGFASDGTPRGETEICP